MQKILISACLLGQPVRYDGKGFALENTLLQSWLEQGRLYAFCPEVAAGLPIPRAAAEIQNGDGNAVLAGQARVVDVTGQDVTEFFLHGAELALSACQAQNIGLAILTESSPSCGSHQINNGQFEHVKIPGFGVVTALLREHGISVFSQHEMTKVASLIGANAD